MSDTVPSGRAHRRPLCRALTLGLPTLWGATALTYKLTCPLAERHLFCARLLTNVVFFGVGSALILFANRGLLRELRQVHRVAGAAQSVLLRPLPARIEGLSIAAARLSAEHGAVVGGDLYEAIGTEYGVRVVMGDVRGHGLAALGTVAAVLGSFREAAHDEPELGGLLRRLDRALERHLGAGTGTAHGETPGEDTGGATGEASAEEFVTVLLLEIGADGELRALNCGHPWPYLLGEDRVEPLTAAEPLPPLGLFPLPADLPAVVCPQLLPGEALFLHTDGAEDARDAHGRFFPLRAALAAAVREGPPFPQSVLRIVFTLLLRHAGTSPSDDAALLVLHRDRGRAPGPPPSPGGRHAGHRARPGRR
ncbi:PP2C family protein-serine/threonine phosphatase [Streptomyces sp. NPDC047000]|uniref:PP2C family protein-serine/threonine phosphatase n=1 Tax=Streptomyces sp. NPDC047000 TaxID=3155474 RepID=UPI0033F22472